MTDPALIARVEAIARDMLHFADGKSRAADLRALLARVHELEEERDAARAALKPFAKLAYTGTVTAAAKQDTLLTLSNGQRMCGIDASAFIAAAFALASAPAEDGG